MIISDLAKSASNEHIFYLMQKAHKHGYFVHPEFYEEFDRRAEHIDIHEPLFYIDYSSIEERMMAYAESLGPSRMRQHINVRGTVTGRFPSRPNIDSSQGFKLNV